MQLLSGIRIATNILKSKFFVGMRVPLSVYLSITDRCPVACNYCNIPNRRMKEMSTEQIFSLIRQIKKAGAERLQLAGGEPLIRSDIGEIVNCAKDNGLYVTAASTGFFTEKINSIKNIDMIFLSFDGEREVHDRHKGKGAYNRLMEAINKLKELNINFCTTTVITKINKDSIDFILDTAKKYDFFTVFQPLYYTSIPYENHFHLAKVSDSLMLTNEEVRNVFNKLLIHKKKGAFIASSFPYLEYIKNWQDYSKIYSSEKDNHVKCWAGRLFCYIDTNGLVYPCGDSIGVVEGRDCLAVGFKNAFGKINLNRKCQSCIIACDLEKNLTFSFNIRTILNWLKLIH